MMPVREDPDAEITEMPFQLTKLEEASPCSDTAPTKASSEDEEAEPGFALPEKETDLEEMLADIRRAVEAQDFSVARDISKPSAKVLFTHKSDPPRDMVLFSINSKEQVATIPLLNIKDNKIVCGTIPTVWAIPHWPLWFPFCESNKLLRRFSPSSFIMNCTLKVLFLRIDFVVLVDIADKLHTEEECLEILMRSPPAGSEGEEWMGITVPPKCGSLPRICIRESRLKMRPTASDQFQCDLQLEMDDPAQAPTWAKVFVFQQLGLRIIPEMCKFQPKIPGSPLDTYLNGSDKKDMEGEMIPPEGLEYIRQMDESIRKYHAGRSLKQGTSKSSGRSHSFSNSKKVLQELGEL